MKWKEYIIEDLFDKIKTGKIAAKANDFPITPTEKCSLPLLTAGAENQGLARYAKREQCPTILKNVITISANGANTGVTYYQDEEFAVLQDAYAIGLKDMDIPTKEVGLFLASCIGKVLHGNFSWTYKAGWERIKRLSISLPVKTEYIPDFELLSEYSGGGISMRDIDTSSWKKFRLNELFGVPRRGTRIVKEHRIKGKIPLVTAGFNNQGIAEFIANEKQETFNGGFTIDMFGNCFYRDYAFKADDNILVFDSDIISKEAKMFIATVINKVTNGSYSYSRQFRMKSFNETVIYLPVKETDVIDWDYMQEYIEELEQERIEELEQYLVVTGLNDYELTEEDIETLSLFAVSGVTEK